MKEQIKTPEKGLNEMEIAIYQCRVQNTGYKDAQRTQGEDLNSIKKIQSEMKDTLIEIKNNLQGNNSRADEAKNLINDLEHKEAKNNPAEQEEEKRVQKTKDKQPMA